MNIDELFAVLFSDAAPDDASDMRRFLRTWLPAGGAPDDPFARLVRIAVRADRRSAAAAAGHQAAIYRLFPTLEEGAVSAFCVSEEGGARPTAIRARLVPAADGGFRLSGEKKWGTMSPDADVLFVAASTGTEHVDGKERNRIRMVRVPAGRPGIRLLPRLHEGVESEMRIADVSLHDVSVEASDVFDGDGFQSYVKPFRLIEDVFGVAATQIAAFRFGLRHGWPEASLEDLLGLVLQAWAISRTGMSSPAEVLTMASYFRRSTEQWESLSGAWATAPESERALWQPATGLLHVAQKARDVGRQRAWGALGRAPSVAE